LCSCNTHTLTMKMSICPPDWEWSSAPSFVENPMRACLSPLTFPKRHSFTHDTKFSLHVQTLYSSICKKRMQLLCFVLVEANNNPLEYIVYRVAHYCFTYERAKQVIPSV